MSSQRMCYSAFNELHCYEAVILYISTSQISTMRTLGLHIATFSVVSLSVSLSLFLSIPLSLFLSQGFRGYLLSLSSTLVSCVSFLSLPLFVFSQCGFCVSSGKGSVLMFVVVYASRRIMGVKGGWCGGVLVPISSACLSKGHALGSGLAWPATPRFYCFIKPPVPCARREKLACAPRARAVNPG